jgi:2-oxoglutarate ferredoxin oxidoreductase subunit beta
VVTKEDYGKFETAWCPGCGNFMLLESLKSALAASGLKPNEVLIVSGIGQAAKTPQYLYCNMFNGLHGRALPAATGAKLANHELVVIVESGDGCIYGEGGNHLVNAIRRNINITCLVHNNQVYGLTKGQASPTSDLGLETGTSPSGNYVEPYNPLTAAIALNCGFVARAFVGEQEHLSKLIQKGIEYRGFALIDILQPCPTFNKVNTFKWYRDRVYKLENTTYDPTDKTAAFVRSQECGEKIPVGVLCNRERDTLESHEAAIKKKPLVKREWKPQLLETIIESLR